MRVKRPIRIEGDIAYVPLTMGYEAVIDAADVHLIEGYNWSAQPGVSTVYAARRKTIGGRLCTIRMHRVLMGDPSGLDVDHRDRDGLNNRRSNLRCATRSENNRNQPTPKHNTSGLKGVTWDRSRNMWRSQIKLHGKTHTLGRFHSPDEAHRAYCEASATLHGDFGRVS